MANDADGRRCSMLAHHSRRMRSPAFIITHHDATTLPMPPGKGDSPDGFDRILCDVPCTGDGTHRKAPHLWKKWSNASAMGLHPLQLKIALRAATLLRVGGNMCYSTCSLNPIENEAVVAEILRGAEGALEIVNVSDRLPDLKRFPGMIKWKVMTSDQKFFESHKESLDSRKTTTKRGFFQPNEEEAKTMGLEHCLRLHPQLQDTGGFFVCILRKVKELPEGAEFYATKAENGVKRPAEDSTQEPDKEEEAAMAAAVELAVENKDLPTMLKADPFLQLSSGKVTGGQETLAELVKFFELDPSFPQEQLFARSAQAGRIVLVSPAIRHLLEEDAAQNFKAINSGVRVFEKCNFMSNDRGCTYRLMQEGVELIAPYVSEKRKRAVSVEDLTIITAKKSVRIEELTDTELKSCLLSLSYGSVILTCKIPDSEEVITAVCERGEHFIQLFVDKEETL